MLNPFPIQFLALLAYFILRVFVGGILLHLGWKHLQHRDTLMVKKAFATLKNTALLGIFLGATEIVLGTLFILGLYTQIAALLTMVTAVKLIVFSGKFNAKYQQSRSFALLLFAASLSLFITGAGAFAFDLPI